jgi:hypothetical protein
VREAEAVTPSGKGPGSYARLPAGEAGLSFTFRTSVFLSGKWDASLYLSPGGWGLAQQSVAAWYRQWEIQAHPAERLGRGRSASATVVLRSHTDTTTPKHSIKSKW